MKTLRSLLLGALLLQGCGCSQMRHIVHDGTLAERTDTVQVYVVTTIVEQLNADASNMRHIYPYRDLVAENILPEGLNRAEQNSFYQCFANSVDNTYSNATQLVNAIIADTVQTSQIRQMQAACANALFGWTVEIIEVD